MGQIHDAINAAEQGREALRRTRALAQSLAPRPSRVVVLTHVGGSRTGETERFSEPSILIGRGHHNDVALDLFDDSTVSTQHAEIRREGSRYVIYDMGSLNGTLVNGHPVRRVSLRSRDEIELGHTGPRIRFELEDGGEPDEHPAGPTAATGPATEAVAQPFVFEEDPMRKRLLVALYVLTGWVVIDTVVSLVVLLRG